MKELRLGEKLTKDELLSMYDKIFVAEHFRKKREEEKIKLIVKVREEREAEIRKEIFETTGQAIIPVGTKVRDIRTGSEGTIIEAYRLSNLWFDKTTGWFCYVLDTDEESCFSREGDKHYHRDMILI